jgi:hypothetical protein
LGIEIRTGTRNVVRKDYYITGEWASEPTVYRIDKGRPIALDLLNAPHVGKRSYTDSALDFTQKFGPLTIPFGRTASFRFSIAEWKAARRELHFAWKAASSSVKRGQPLNLPLDGDHFSLYKGQITFRTHKLITYMALEIVTIPAKSLRMPANFEYGCKSPFFFASDLRERYCSQRCAHDAKKRVKLKWWNENRKEK